jgi:hypothetical protein
MLPQQYAIVKDQVTPCGLQCGECDMGNGNVTETIQKLEDYIHRYDVDKWAGLVPGGKDIDFNHLDKDLIWLRENMRCPGCLNGGGNPDCPIRLCSKEKGFSSCAQCADLQACSKFNWLGEKGEMLRNKLVEGP